jgi:N-acetylglucosaminyl-diphospho-decaprenol L-rhamnosyltransferase
VTSGLSLSIVVVCFRESPVRLLDELSRQRAPGDEVIVVDNAATIGGTPDVRGHPTVDRVLEMPTNGGFSRAANAGAQVARGDAVLLLNPDSVPARGCLDALRRPPADWDAWMGVVTLADVERINTAGGESHFLGFSWAGRLGEPVSSLPQDPYPTGFLSGACMAVRRDAWRAVGGLPGHFFLYCEDVDLSHRLRLAGRQFGVVPAARMAHDYVFDKGAYKWRHLERNRWAMILRTYPGPLLALVLPALLVCEPALLLVAVASGWAPSKLLAWLDVIAWLPRMPAERRRVREMAVVSPRVFAAGLTASLDSEFLGRPGRSRPLRGAVAAYWRLVTALLPGRR